MIALVLDHLWQSTLAAAAVALMTLAFRRTGAAVRHGLWLAASIKFLVPFAALAALGRLLPPIGPYPADATREAMLIAQAAQPFSPSPVAAAPIPPAPAVHAAAHAHAGPAFDAAPALLALWAAGCIAVLACWLASWLKVRAAVRAARPLDWTAPMPVLASPSLLEPGLVGLLRPVLLVPETLTRHLSPLEIRSIVAHEAWHLRRRDNHTAAVHMLVQALFWFHPLVWWIGARLNEEREWACDEGVVRAGHDPAAYARSLLETCRLYVRSPLACVAGATGSSLKTRIETIMAARHAQRLSATGKALLLAAGLCTLASPVAAGWLTSPAGRTTVTRVEAVASSLAPARAPPAPALLPRPESRLELAARGAIRPIAVRPDLVPVQQLVPVEAQTAAAVTATETSPTPAAQAQPIPALALEPAKPAAPAKRAGHWRYPSYEVAPGRGNCFPVFGDLHCEESEPATPPDEAARSPSAKPIASTEPAPSGQRPQPTAVLASAQVFSF